jgi:hypothetical protein
MRSNRGQRWCILSNGWATRHRPPCALHALISLRSPSVCRGESARACFNNGARKGSAEAQQRENRGAHDVCLWMGPYPFLLSALPLFFPVANEERIAQRPAWQFKVGMDARLAQQSVPRDRGAVRTTPVHAPRRHGMASPKALSVSTYGHSCARNTYLSKRRPVA